MSILFVNSAKMSLNLRFRNPSRPLHTVHILNDGVDGVVGRGVHEDFEGVIKMSSLALLLETADDSNLPLRLYCLELPLVQVEIIDFLRESFPVLIVW